MERETEDRRTLNAGTYLFFLILPKRNTKSFVRSAFFALSYVMTSKKHAHTHTVFHNVVCRNIRTGMIEQRGIITSFASSAFAFMLVHHYIKHIKTEGGHGILEVRKREKFYKLYHACF